VSTAQFGSVVPNQRLFSLTTGGGVPPTGRSLKVITPDGCIEISAASPTTNISGAATVYDVSRLISSYRIGAARVGIRLVCMRQSISQVQHTFHLFDDTIEPGTLRIDLKKLSHTFTKVMYDPEQMNRACFQTDCLKEVLLFPTGSCVILCCISEREAQRVAERLFRWVKPFVVLRPKKAHK
jgi:hypothetical protein